MTRKNWIQWIDILVNCNWVAPGGSSKVNQSRKGPNCPEISMKLRLTDYETLAQDGGKIVSLTQRPSFTPRI